VPSGLAVSPGEAVQAENCEKRALSEGAVENAHEVRLATKQTKQYRQSAGVVLGQINAR
jgi:hypothetical protein